jgi:hypothetical protein
MFPDEFYEQIYQLRGWNYKEDSSQRPGIVSHYTIDLVYDRPGTISIAYASGRCSSTQRRYSNLRWN